MVDTSIPKSLLLFESLNWMMGKKLLFILIFKFLKDIIYLFIYFRQGKGRRKRGREISMCGCLSLGT